LKRTPLRSRAQRKLYDDTEMRTAWIRHVLAQAPKDEQGKQVCPVCRRRPDRNNRLEGHHIVERQYLRKHVRAQRLPAEQAARLLARLFWDVRNGLPVCTRCHDKHTRGKQRIPFALIDAKAHQFAREVLADYTLDRYYDRAA
jgi:hypothetical protein